MDGEMKYLPTIGLEIHVQLNTASKVFCGCRNVFGDEPNQNICPICLGLPGALPSLNREAVMMVAKLGLALNSTINERCRFDRKNYFYPDLPKGYQISQYDQPICSGGYLAVSDGESHRRIHLNRIHLEEDAGKLVYISTDETLVDLNRCGAPLAEIVTEPEMHSAREAGCFLREARRLVRWLRISDGDMEKGSLRCDVNVSLGEDEKAGIPIEVKNLNSIHGVERAIKHEIGRQTDILRDGGTIAHQTRMWDENTRTTIASRDKEKGCDYRYFPEPDLVELVLAESEISELKQSLPELPNIRRGRFIKDFGVRETDADLLTADREIADYFEQAVHSAPDAASQVVRLILGEGLRWRKESESGDDFAVPADAVAKLAELEAKGKISHATAKLVFEQMVKTAENDPLKIIIQQDLLIKDDVERLRTLIQKVLDVNIEELKRYKAGDKKLFGFFMGEVMRAAASAEPSAVKTMLSEALEVQ